MKHRAQRASRRRQRGIHRYQPQLIHIARAQRRADIKAVPADPEDEGAQGGERQIRRRRRPTKDAARARTQHISAHQRDDAAGHVHDR